MATIPFKKLEKMKIIPYKNYKDGVLSGEDPTFTVMYNPTSLSVQHGLNIIEKPQIGAPTPQDKEVLNGQSSTFSVELFFDGTGASASGGLSASGVINTFKALGSSFVKKQIKKFYDATLSFSNTTHAPRYLKVIWGDGFMFSCQLQTATTNYLLFDKGGNPLRATISASFTEIRDTSNNEQSNPKGKLGFFSPDITKLHTVVAGDTIYNIAKNEYESESYYLQIAETNDLKNYRKLVPGTQLILPPIKKN